MRMIVPPIISRREIDRNLVIFFREHRPSSFKRAISGFCRYYNVRLPSIEWYEYIDWGKTVGKTFEDGRIHLVHPENWKRGRIYKTERMWVQAVYHEMGHYLFWTDAERKADAFTRRMVNGLRRVGRRMRPGSRTGALGIRRAEMRTSAARAQRRRKGNLGRAGRRARRARRA